MRAAVSLLLLVSCSLLSTSAFFVVVVQRRKVNTAAVHLHHATTDDSDSSWNEIRSMRVKDLKAELSALQVSTKDAFEKEELVQRLWKAREKNTVNAKKKKKKSTEDTTSTTTTSNKNRGASCTGTVVVVPLRLVSVDAGQRISAVNGHDITVDAKAQDHPYPSIRIQVLESSGSSSSFPLQLLLDTACSGIVLRPSVVQQYSSSLPRLTTPVTMTGAGGVAGSTGLTQLDRFRLEDDDEDDENSPVFGPLPVAVQDIGALPRTLDGIIGLSFLQQFEGISMDFTERTVAFFYPRGSTPSFSADPPSSEAWSIAAQSSMTMLPRLGIYTVDVLLGGRGPVKMLVDTGASDTFLNWKGVEDLGLDRNKDKNFIERLSNPMGAVGSDAVAMRLTHRIHISSTLDLSSGGKKAASRNTGVSLAGTRRLSIDIGEIAILENLRGEGVGGILGIDTFMRCDGARIKFQGRGSFLQLMQRTTDAQRSGKSA